ncbi:Signal transduction histidine kinase with PAS domain [Halanaeroarchaeum sp. HSR-CO]|uniref:receiver/sensor box histidine kinase n=1 Tax=Halanaeroarchaeum sp. HSR-CO TaxID=2866382 RepID=UPI00217EC2E5|nr:ATP-binding protein [Halanaeroarchaeum sp. HSR-CO]UWG47871.1 Signal transduction histidine kinase with PAS domain [Halanaeroarchaeum sp. HSR-CO]
MNTSQTESGDSAANDSGLIRNRWWSWMSTIRFGGRVLCNRFNVDLSPLSSIVQFLEPQRIQISTLLNRTVQYHALLYGISLGVIVVQVFSGFLAEDLRFVSVIVGIVFPALISLSFFGSVLLIHRMSWTTSELRTVVWWVVGVLVIFCFVTGGLMVNWAVNGHSVYRPVTTIATVGSAGGTTGAAIGRYNIKQVRAETNQDYLTRILRGYIRAIDGASFGVVICEIIRRDRSIVYANDAALELLDASREETIGTTLEDVIAEKTDTNTIERLRKSTASGEAVTIEFPNRLGEKGKVLVKLQCVPVTDDTGDIVNWVGLLQNIRERKERVHQLKALDRFLRHNYRNKLNIIRGHGELIRSQASAAATRESSNQIITASDSLLKLTENSHEITTLLTEPQEKETIGLGDLIRRVTSSVKTEYPGASIDVSKSGNLDVKACAKFDQALKEVITNAIVHNDDEQPEVSIFAEETDDCVRIDVADTGPYISKHEIDILLADREQTPLQHGSGLGLWLVKLLVTRSGGNLHIERNSPRGNIIKIALPKAQEDSLRE